MKSYRIAKVKIDGASESEVIDLIRRAVRDKQKTQLATINNEFIVEAQKNSEFREVLNKCDLAIAESTGVVWAVKRLYGEKIARLPGADLFEEICDAAASEGWRIFLFGGAEGVALQAARSLRTKRPRLQVSGILDGVPVTADNPSSEIIEQINCSKTDILFVALGAPKQDLWIAKNLPSLNVKVAVGVGGTFDFAAGKIKRAPRWLRKIGLEWLYRLMREPRRFKRIWTATVTFPLLVYRVKKET